MSLFELDHRHEDAGEGVSPSDLLRAEEALGYSFPKPYREFLLEHNGVSFCCELDQELACGAFLSFSLDERPTEPVPSVAEIDRELYEQLFASLKSVGELDAINADFFDSVQRDPMKDVYFGWAPKHIWPIGWDDSGVRTCLSLDGEDFGAIYTWSSPCVPFEERDQWPDMAFFRWVADDFKAFWDAVTLVSYDRIDALTG